MLKQIDIFGSRYIFHVLGNSSFRSSFGGLVSIFSLMAMVILFIMLGRNFYKGENPIISMSKEYSKEYFNYTLTSKDFLFGFQIVDQDSNLFERPDLFYIEPHYLEYKKNKEGVNLKTTDRVLKYHKCSESDTNFHPAFHSTQLYTYYCFDDLNRKEGLDLGGLWDGQEFRYIKIKVRHCLTASKYNKENNITCSTNKTEIEYHMNNYKYFQFFIQNYFVNSNDYEDPFKLSLNVIYETMDLKAQKKLYYYFKQGVFEDKKGWFTEEAEVKTLIGIDRTRLDFMNSVADYFSTTYYETNLYFDKITETYNRRYMKIQEVIANIGGIMKSIVFASSIFITFYNNFLMYNAIIFEAGKNKIIKTLQGSSNKCNERFIFKDLNESGSRKQSNDLKSNLDGFSSSNNNNNENKSNRHLVNNFLLKDKKSKTFTDNPHQRKTNNQGKKKSFGSVNNDPNHFKNHQNYNNYKLTDNSQTSTIPINNINQYSPQKFALERSQRNFTKENNEYTQQQNKFGNEDKFNATRPNKNMIPESYYNQTMDKNEGSNKIPYITENNENKQNKLNENKEKIKKDLNGEAIRDNESKEVINFNNDDLIEKKNEQNILTPSAADRITTNNYDDNFFLKSNKNHKIPKFLINTRKNQLYENIGKGHDNTNANYSVNKINLFKNETFENEKEQMNKGFIKGSDYKITFCSFVKNLFVKETKKDQAYLYFIKMKKAIDSNLEITNLLSLSSSIKDIN